MIQEIHWLGIGPTRDLRMSFAPRFNVLTDAVPQPIRARAEYTLQRLKLDRGHNMLRRRNYWDRQHSVGGLTIPLLVVYAPLVARAIQEWIRVRGLPLPDIAPFN